MPPKQKDTPRSLMRAIIAADTPASASSSSTARAGRALGTSPSMRAGKPPTGRTPPSGRKGAKETPRALLRGILANETPASVVQARPPRQKAVRTPSSPARGAASPAKATPVPAPPTPDTPPVDVGGYGATPDTVDRFANAEYSFGTDDITTTAARFVAGLPPTPVVGGVLADAPPAVARSALGKGDGKAPTMFHPRFVARLFGSFTTMRVTRDANEELMDITHRYFTQVSEDLAAAATHAKRARIEEADVERLFERQHLVDRQRPLEDLARALLPVEELEQFVPVARAHNVVQPAAARQRKRRTPRRASS